MFVEQEERFQYIAESQDNRSDGRFSKVKYTMSIATTIRKPRSTDKVSLQRMAAARNAEMGIEYNPHATAADSRREIERCGLSSDENLFSNAIIAARRDEQPVV